MSFLRSVTPSSRFENLGGGYLTQSSFGGEGFDSVGFIAGKKVSTTSVLPGPDNPIPTTTQKPNRGSNVAIVYARTASNFVQSGEIVFVDRYSDGGAPSKGANPAMRGGSGTSQARVATIEQINSVLANEEPVGTREEIASPSHEAFRWNLDGVCLSIDSDDAAALQPGSGFTSNYRPYPLLNVVIQNHAPTLSDSIEERAGEGPWLRSPKLESRKICPKGSCAGAVIYVGLFAVESEKIPGQYIGKMRRFCSEDVTNEKEDLDGLQVAWQLGKVVDTNASSKPRKVSVAVRVRKMEEEAILFQDNPPFSRPPYVTDKDIENGDTRTLRTPISPKYELQSKNSNSPPFVHGVASLSVKDQLIMKWIDSDLVRAVREERARATALEEAKETRALADAAGFEDIFAKAGGNPLPIQIES